MGAEEENNHYPLQLLTFNELQLCAEGIPCHLSFILLTALSLFYRKHNQGSMQLKDLPPRQPAHEWGQRQDLKLGSSVCIFHRHNLHAAFLSSLTKTAREALSHNPPTMGSARGHA